MTTLMLEGGNLVTPLEERFTNLWLQDTTIVALQDNPPDNLSYYKRLDVHNCWVTPGLFDLQVNGGPNCNLWADPKLLELKALAQELARVGVTGFLPTLITDEIDHLKKNLAFLKSALSITPEEQLTANMPGIHLEGPCLSPDKPGVHPVKHLQPLSISLMKELLSDEVVLVTVAPELDPSGEVIKFLLAQNVVVALGHSNASFEEAKSAFRQGVSLVTHTFNALPPLNHRFPGAIGAALEDNRVTCSIIADGLHVDPSMLNLLIRHKGIANVVLVSDRAYIGTSQGGLVGSSITLNQAVQNLVKWDIVRFADAIRMASLNPCSVLGLTDRLGLLAAGKQADVVVWDKDTLDIKHVIVSGQMIF
ncbi:MAG: amidohydrolase family protein [Candidatus Melainabacteria bacterium]|nr:amidohydrolase family protein [Candidatus Melainabacteria bacterium]